MASATDIITYIGVPLAVLGVMPVLYTFVIAIITQQRIKRELKKNHIDAITRTSLMSGVVEVEHPRYSLQPLTREDPEYWLKSANRSAIRGGSWTMFHWHKIITGRVNIHLQLRDHMYQPQAEIDFERLVTFLLDRGAVPNAEGVRLLKTMGLQTPRMTPILTTPGGVKRSILVVTNPDESDGHLSLSLFWADDLSARDSSSLPPYWTRLLPGETLLEKGPAISSAVVSPEAKEEITKPEDKVEEPMNENGDATDTSNEKVPIEDINGIGKVEASANPELDALDAEERKKRLPVRLYIGETGLEDARSETSDGTDIYGLIRIDHLRYNYPGSAVNMNLWFACAAVTTLGESHKGLWRYTISPAIIQFSKKDSMPHGVLVWLGMIEEEETPISKARREAREQQIIQRKHQDFLDGIRQRDLEKNMPEQLRQTAQRQRQMKWAEDMMQRHRQEERDRLDEEFRKQESSLNSPRVSQTIVSNACHEWLIKKEHVPDTFTKQNICEQTLHRMIFDEDFSCRLCKVLDTWKGWSEIGVMNDKHLNELKESQIDFAYAGIILSIIAERSLSAESWAGSDLAECQRVFRHVYVG